MRVLKSISSTNILRGAKEPKLDDAGKPVMGDDGKPVMIGFRMNVNRDVYITFGTADKVREGTTGFGDFQEFQGVFEVKRLIDGETFHASKQIFPPPTNDLVWNNYLAAKVQDKDAKVDMAFVIGTEEYNRATGQNDENGNPIIERKYRWTCRPLDVGGVAKVDPLANLRAELLKGEAAYLLGGPAPNAALSAPAEVDEKGAKAKAKETA